MIEGQLIRLQTAVRQGLSFAMNVMADNDIPASPENLRETLKEWDGEVQVELNTLLDLIIEQECEFKLNEK